MKLTFTVETGTPDSNGDIVNLDGVNIPDKVTIVENFDRTKPVSMAVVVREGNSLKATAEIPDRLLDKYPAIGFSVKKYHAEGAAKVFDEIDLQCVGLCTKENPNPDIKTVRGQAVNQIVYLYWKNGKIEIHSKNDRWPVSDDDLFMWSYKSREENADWVYKDGEWVYVGKLADESHVCQSCGSRNCIC
jgi:hypothetical protein